MSFDLEGARKAGYSDDEIADFLAPTFKFDIAGARKAGYTGAEIVGHLAPMDPPKGMLERIKDSYTKGSGAIFPDAQDVAALPSGDLAAMEIGAPAPATAAAVETARPGGGSFGDDIASASKQGVYGFGSGLLDTFWAMAQSGERKRTDGPTLSDAAASAVPVVGALTNGLQEAARLLAPKNEQDRVQRIELATKLDEAAEAMAPELQKQSFDSAYSKGRALEWMMVQAASQSPQIATMLASILFPPIAPVTLPTMGATAAGNQYAENVKAGVPQERAALDAAINGLTELASEAAGFKIGSLAGKGFEKILETIPAGMRSAAASSILARVAAGGATLTGAAVLEGTSEALGQVVQDISQEKIAGRDAGDMGENVRTAFFASLLPGAAFAAPKTIAQATRPTASTVPIEGKDLDTQIKDILSAPITEIIPNAPPGPETIPVSTSADDLADIGLSAPAATETITPELAAPAAELATTPAVSETVEPPAAPVDFTTTFPTPIEGATIPPDQMAKIHSEVIDVLRDSRAAGETETYQHVLDAYSQSFGPQAARDLNEHIMATPDARATAQSTETTAPAESSSQPAVDATAAVAKEVNDARTVESEAGSGESAGTTTAAAVVAGTAAAAEVSRPGEAASGRDLERAKDQADEDRARVKDFATRRGEVKSFKTEKQAALYAKQPTNRVPKTYKPRDTGDGWVLSAPNLERTEAQKANDRKLARERSRIDPAKDSLATMIGKLGGIRAEDLLTDGVDKPGLKALRSGVVGKPAYRAKGGLSLDGLAEILDEYGFNLKDENGAIDAYKLRELIQEELDGNRVYTPEGYERLAGQAAEERDREARAVMENDFNEDELRRAGYDDLSDEARAFVEQAFALDLDGRIAATLDSTQEAISDEQASRLFDQWSAAAASQPEVAAPGRAGEGNEGREAPPRNEGKPEEVAGEAKTETPPDGGVSTSGSELELKGETEAEIRARETTAAKAAEQERKKAAAPDASDFRLSGSDSPADQARARGQQELVPAASAGEIADFGQKIGGARKDVWTSYQDQLRDAGDVDVAAEPLSKSWPAPDYQALLDGGADPWAVAFMHAARDAIPIKPKKSWKLKAWVEAVTQLRTLTLRLANGTAEVGQDSVVVVLARLDNRLTNGIADRIDLYQAVGHSKSLAGVQVSVGEYGVFDGKTHSPPKVIWSVQKEVQATALSNWPRVLATGSTRKEAIANFQAAYAGLEITKPASKEATFDIYSERGKDGYFVGKKIGRNIAELAGPFTTVKEARTYKAEHQDDLVKKLEKVKEIPNERRDTNRPRAGEDMRGGADVTPQQFGEVFGFRGVEFGNYVEQGKRQRDLNDAYDALMDMAAVLDIPPKAISLNGELGLAFGARGTGGKQGAAAHYERDFVVINLTKRDGAGSLGHEWWHALDNYFSRARGKTIDMTTEALDVSLASRNSPFVNNTTMRSEMIEAFGAVVRAIKSTALKARSAKLDAKRTKEYWTTGPEMSARAFESYLISKLQDQNASNDYLANIVDEQTWAAAESMGFELEGSYPYPTAGEVPAIRAGFEQFFNAIESKETEKGVALFKRGTGEGIERDRAEIIVKRLGLQANVVETEQELPQHLRDQIEADGAQGEVRGVYDPQTGAVYLVSSHLDSEAQAIMVALHESAHRGLVKIFGRDLRPILSHIYLSNPKVREAANRKMKELGLDQVVATEEVIADMATRGQAHNLKGWDRFVTFLRKWLVDHGFKIEVSDSMAEFIAGAAAEAGKKEAHVFAKEDAARFHLAFHGTPHDFDRFDVNKIGTGEGAQAFGYGLYFAGNREVAEHYRQSLSTGVDRVRMLAEPYDGETDAFAIEKLRHAAKQARFNERNGEAKDYEDTIRWIESGRPARWSAGRLYEVEIAPKESEYLDWHKTYDEQSPEVKAALESVDVYPEDFEGTEETGESIYHSIGFGRVHDGAEGGDRAASKMLAVAGIPGIKFLDQGSRFGRKPYRGDPAYLKAAENFKESGVSAAEALAGLRKAYKDADRAQLLAAVNEAYDVAPERHYNYVIFDDKNVEVRAKYSRRGPTGNAKLDSFDEKAGLVRTKESLATRMKDQLARPWGDIKAAFRARMDERTQALADRFHGIKLAEQRLSNLPAEQSAYVAARLSTGVPSVMRYLMLFGQVEWDNGILARKQDTKGLLEIFQPVKADFDDWVRWMVAKRAERLLAEGKEHNFTAAEIREAIDASRENEVRFKGVAREFAAFKRSVLDVAEKAGLVDASTRPMWDQADWIPFYRVVEGETKGPGGKRGLAGQNSGIRTLKGGNAQLNDPLENMIQNFSHLIDASMKNHAVDQALRNLGEESGVFEKVGMEMKRALIPLSQIRKTLKDQGVAADLVESIPEDALIGVQKMWSVVAPTDPDVIRVMRDGKPEYYRVNDPLLLRALTSVQGQGQLWTKVLRPFKTVLTRAITSAPDFIARNFIRDSMQAWTIDENGFNAGIDSIRGLKKSLAKEGGMLDMMAAGASFAGGYTFGTDPEATAQNIRRSLRERGWSASAVDGYLATLIDTPTKLLEKWEELGSAVENANREAVYEAARNAGKSKADAIYTAKDLMDYSMMGDSQMIAMANDLLPFFNARLQGTYKLARAVAENPQRVMVRGMVLSVMSLALLGMNWGDDRYEELEDWDKDSNWHFWIGSKHFRIPKPFELGFFFGTVAERVARGIGGKDEPGKVMKQLLVGMRDQLAMNPTPQVVMPLAELWANKDTFTGRAIEGMADEGKLPHARYSEQTSATMRAITDTMPATADFLGMSPKKLEHLWSGYLGTVGMYVLGLSDMAVRAATNAPDRPALRPDDIPVVKAFYRADPARATIFKTELYDLREKADQAYKTVHALAKEGRDVEEEVKRNEKALATRPAVDAAAKAMTDLGKQIDVIYRDRTMTPAEKRLRVDEIIQAQNDVAQQTVTAVKPMLR